MLIYGEFEVASMELVFIFLDILGLIVSLAYFRRGLRSSGVLTILLAALTLVKVMWIRVLGGVCVVLITICFVLFRTQFGAKILRLFGRDSNGKKL